MPGRQPLAASVVHACKASDYAAFRGWHITPHHTTQHDCLCPCCCASAVLVQVLSMLVDIQWGSISSRQLGQQAPHQLWGRTMEALSAMPGVEVTLQQVRCAALLLILLLD